MRHWQAPGEPSSQSDPGKRGAGKWTRKWAEKRILFVSGKGGVGKSVIAAAIAREAAGDGRRVLLAEIGDNSYYKDFWKLPRVGHDPIRLPLGFDLALWNAESALREYVLYYLRMERLYKLFFENKVMRALINVAPGLAEIAILGKITSGLRKVGPPLDYDLIVVDCYATGHALALLNTPKGVQEAIKVGPMGSHSREIQQVIQDSSLSGYVVVTLLEEMPVIETLEFKQKLKADLGAEADVVANKSLRLPVAIEDLKVLEAADPRGLGEFARYLHTIRDRQDQFLGQLKEAAGEVPEVPLVFSADPNELIEGVGEALRRA